MPADLVWSPLAQADIRRIYVDIGREQPLAAERFYERFQHKANLLIDQPRLGMRHPAISPAARMLVESPFVILYETIPDSDEGPVKIVEIVRVINGRRDLESLFS
ncbi:type II toxin-antitoxin system RelE/ParE family toxin [Rhizobium sp. LjRoot98]|uniref:type II toxin-antitoxin system RelE/ParE family toxin n=1 Tax=unclassified Rhizobium TaxID=2613769 RepID=UPI000715FA71|nr:MULTISPECIES: type II toxin-antitoxin system RelE/ParE family toxin [unclassified Rhizobium]KQV29006.1 plasmid stabilization protein [Rhizobium sp. Root1204]KQY03499.1 plasmid stabilization protein [Rhizobium sp. Root1334]KRC00147.1 plasmid stabilization protein [Rhizobium sp. Root73]